MSTLWFWLTRMLSTVDDWTPAQIRGFSLAATTNSLGRRRHKGPDSPLSARVDLDLTLLTTHEDFKEDARCSPSNNTSMIDLLILFSGFESRGDARFIPLENKKTEWKKKIT